MNTKQKNIFWGIPGRVQMYCLMVVFVLLHAQSVSASEKAIEALNFTSLAGNRVQLQLKMNEPVSEPKVFQTDNPARIALDFAGVKSHLSKKSFPIKQGAANSVYVVEADGRTRVIVNLTQSVEFQTKSEGNNYYVVLNASKIVAASESEVKKQLKHSNISKLIPQQIIKGIDFRRGTQGQGRLLLSLSNPNTVVDVKKTGGKVVLNFLNTKLPDKLAKSYDVIDFATPVHRIDAMRRGSGTRITVIPNNDSYDFSTFQSEGLLTVEFRPLTVEEKAAQLKEKFPYTGDKLSLNFQDIEVRSVLQILADFTDLNIIASDSVGGNVTLRLNDVPWDQALALVLKSKGLAKRESGNVIFVAPATEITKMEQDELAANKIVQQLEPLVTEYIQINYAKAEDFSKMLLSRARGQGRTGSSAGLGAQGGAGLPGLPGYNDDERRLISRRGNVIVDSRTNTLIIRDTEDRLKEIRKMISILDKPVRQVLIESRVVIATTDFARNLGVKFGVAKAAEIGSGSVFALGARPTHGELVADDDGKFVTVPEGDSNFLVDLAANAIKSHPVGALGMTLARSADYVLNLELTALENNGNGEVLANPRVLTVDREQAIIKQGVQIPYLSVSQNGTQTQLVDAVLELSVTPQITPSGEVIIDLRVKKDSPDQSTGGIQKREVTTNVQVKDGETVVLGGIYEQQYGSQIYKVPFFGDIPGIGFLFRKKEVSDLKQEMLIFVTPRIVKSALTSY